MLDTPKMSEALDPVGGEFEDAIREVQSEPIPEHLGALAVKLEEALHARLRESEPA